MTEQPWLILHWLSQEGERLAVAHIGVLHLAVTKYYAVPTQA